MYSFLISITKFKIRLKTGYKDYGKMPQINHLSRPCQCAIYSRVLKAQEEKLHLTC